MPQGGQQTVSVALWQHGVVLLDLLWCDVQRGCAGAPEGLVQIVTGYGDTGAALVRSGLGKLVFVGSTEVGRRVLAASAETLTPVTMELGGKDAFVVTDDVDLRQVSGRLEYCSKFMTQPDALQWCLSRPHHDSMEESSRVRARKQSCSLRWVRAGRSSRQRCGHASRAAGRTAPASSASWCTGPCSMTLSGSLRTSSGRCDRCNGWPFSRDACVFLNLA